MNCDLAGIITWLPQKMICQYWIPFAQMICLMVRTMMKMIRSLLHIFIKRTHIFQAWNHKIIQFEKMAEIRVSSLKISGTNLSKMYKILMSIWVIWRNVCAFWTRWQCMVQISASSVIKSTLLFNWLSGLETLTSSGNYWANSWRTNIKQTKM